MTTSVERIVLSNTGTDEDIEKGIQTSTSFGLDDDGNMCINIIQTKEAGRTYVTRCKIPMPAFLETVNKITEEVYT